MTSPLREIFATTAKLQSPTAVDYIPSQVTSLYTVPELCRLCHIRHWTILVVT